MPHSRRVPGIDLFGILRKGNKGTHQGSRNEKDRMFIGKLYFCDRRER
jgi:hypothetical protein